MQSVKFNITDGVVSYRDSNTIRDVVFELVLDYFKRMEAFSAETIGQSDKCLEEASLLLEDIADNVLKFDVEYKD